MKTLILASASPRRKELLEQIGASFTQMSVDIDESVLVDERPATYVERLAREKATAGYRRVNNPEAVVLGSDTTVVIGDVILGKPSCQDESVAMLMQLSGKSHYVLTGVALCSDQGVVSRVVSTQVTFKVLTPDLCKKYWLTGEPVDKAGSYGIQGFGAVFVESLTGSYTGVVGLPLAETAELLQDHGIAIWCQ